MKGRKPKPLGLKLAEGRRVPKGAVEPNIPDGIGNPPAHLDAAGKLEWARVVQLLDLAGILKETDRGILTEYCAWVSYAAKAAKILHREGMKAKGSTKQWIAHPMIRVRAQASAIIAKLSAELGLSPVSRARIGGAGVIGNVPDTNKGSALLDFCGMKIAG